MVSEQPPSPGSDLLSYCCVGHREWRNTQPTKVILLRVGVLSQDVYAEQHFLRPMFKKLQFRKEKTEKQKSWWRPTDFAICWKLKHTVLLVVALHSSFTAACFSRMCRDEAETNSSDAGTLVSGRQSGEKTDRASERAATESSPRRISLTGLFIPHVRTRCEVFFIKEK